MNPAVSTPPPLLPEPPPRPEQALRRLFLTLFLRGRSARGLQRQTVPTSMGRKLAVTLVFYTLFGLLACSFLNQTVFALAIYLEAMTFVFLGMFVAASAGEVLFNREEADILLHRPITPKVMLWAKIRVLVEISLWIAVAFNLIGLVVGIKVSGQPWFPLVHLLATGLEALFCTGCVVLIYQLCLRWFGRERLEGIMTTAQVLIAIAAVMAGQLLPRMVIQLNHVLTIGESSGWIYLLPPAWFAGLDDAVCGSALPGAWLLTLLAVASTTVILWLAFHKLAGDYATGLQVINETQPTRISQSRPRRWLERLVTVPPLGWWLRDPVARSSFLLVLAYLMRDRDAKLRVYPGVAPILVLPFIFLLQSRPGHSADPGFGVPFSGIYAGLVPLIALQLIQYSAQWQAADIFRTAPLASPAQLMHGARRAVVCLLGLPMLGLMALIIWWLQPDQLLMLVPGCLVMPVFSLVGNLRSRGVPFSQPTDAAKAAGRGLSMMVVMILAFILAFATSYAWTQGWFWPFILGLAAACAVVYGLLRWMITRNPWPQM